MRFQFFGGSVVSGVAVTPPAPPAAGRLAGAVAAGIAIAAGALVAPTRAEIQTLYRGGCFTDEEAAKKLERYAAQYATADQWRARAERIRRGVLRGLRLETPPPRGELAPIRRAPLPGDGYTVEAVAFESLPGYWVTGNLYLPQAHGSKIPGVLSPHGHGPDARMHAATQTRCATLARLGGAVLAWDMVGFGESTPVPHKHSETARLQTWNSMRAVDFLLSLGVVDEDRLAVTGESGGGTQSFLLACVDERIDASVPVVQVSAHFYGGCVCESGLPIHKSADHETDNVEIAATFAPRPQLIVSDGGDWTSNVPRTEFPYVRRVYELLGAADAVENAHFADEGHDYGPSKRQAMYRFLAKHFDLDPGAIAHADGKLDESFVAVRRREELLAFPPGAGRPAHALVEADQVISLLDRRE